MKVVVIGAGGIIGQHLHISVPSGIDATFTRRTESHLYRGFDANRVGEPNDLLSELMPNVVVNLSGESNVDWVQQNQPRAFLSNFNNAYELSCWCEVNKAHFIHVSSQAVLDPVNAYGEQKLRADEIIQRGENWSIVRPTFVLGIRPFPGIGRENPAERMLGGQERQSVDDRYFAVAFAWDVAEMIWKLCQGRPTKSVHYVGCPTRVSRYELALLLGSDTVPVKHDDLPGLAPRSLDTSGPYMSGSHHSGTLADGLIRLRAECESRNADDLSYRAKELAAFLHLPHEEVEVRLGQGFRPLHNAVTEDFNRANPKSDEELTEWYRTTDAYLWELTAYHLDRGFNYSGMVGGIAAALKSKGVEEVLCLGDGTGDLSIAIAQAGMVPYYNDLSGSRIAKFAESRFLMRGWEGIELFETGTFEPFIGGGYDAVVSLDFLEHVPQVPKWIEAIYTALNPGGYLVAQNGFNIGSGPGGAMPMHLAVNDRYEKDWDPELFTLGFTQLASNWYQKA